MIKIYKNSHLFSSSQSFGNKVTFCLVSPFYTNQASNPIMSLNMSVRSPFYGIIFHRGPASELDVSEWLLLRKDNVCVAITWSCLIVWWGLRILLIMRLFSGRWHNRTPGETLKCADFKNEPQLSLVSTTKKGRRWDVMWDSVCRWFVVHNFTIFLQRSQYKA